MSLESLSVFVDDELQRTPVMFDQILQEFIDTRPKASLASAAAESHMLHAARRLVGEHRREIVARFCESVREQAATKVMRLADPEHGASRPQSLETLSLVDDEAAAADIEIAHVIETVRDVAEYELRELSAFTSALAGDMDVARNTNPFRPDAYARALHSAAGVLPRGYRPQFMRETSPLLAQQLRTSYAAACTRIESQGIEPAKFRTIVLASSSAGWGRHAATLEALRDSMPIPLEATATDAAAGPRPQRATEAVDIEIEALQAPASSHGRDDDRPLAELLSRLFGRMLSDENVPPQVRRMVAWLQPCALGVARRDPVTLGAYSHPYWQFIDDLAFGAERLYRASPDNEHYFRFAQGLVDDMVREPIQDTALYQWGLARLGAYESHMLEEHTRQLRPQIEMLARLPDELTLRNVAPCSAALPPDVPAPVVPADLMKIAQRAQRSPEHTPTLPAARVGQWTELFLQGWWRELQLVWIDERERLRLYREIDSVQTWALWRTAFDRLHAEGLMRSLRPRSLVKTAAHRLLSDGGLINT